MRPFTHHVRIAAVGLMALALTGLVGCSPSASLERDTSAHATLDRETVQVRYPIDEFQLSEEDNMVLSRARAVAMAPCIRAKGYTFDTSDDEAPAEYRPYGLWSVERAGTFGSDMPRTKAQAAGQPESAKPANTVPDEVHGQCFKEAQGEFEAFKPKDLAADPGIANRINGDARAAAEASPEWNSARDKWAACLRHKGLTAIDAGQGWSAKEALPVLEQLSTNPTPELRQEDIRIAVIEASCNEETKLTQTLADLEASYQAPLIRKNQAALNEEKKHNQAVVAAARQYVETHQ